MENKKKEKKDFTGMIVIFFLLIFSWGIPSLIRGEGFGDGITDNISALFSLLIILIILIVIFKISTK